MLLTDFHYSVGKEKCLLKRILLNAISNYNNKKSCHKQSASLMPEESDSVCREVKPSKTSPNDTAPSQSQGGDG